MASVPQLNLVSLIVADMEATVSFYRRLGLTIPDADPAWADLHRSATMPGDMRLDFDSVDFVSKWDHGWPGPGAGSAFVGFAVETRDEVDLIHADMTSAGYPSQQEPFDAFWGARYAVLADPDGNPVGIMSPLDPAFQSAPPD
jgi:catechol 2,3-dioxygenase-like lactoylglutathione lyase family enzyme